MKTESPSQLDEVVNFGSANDFVAFKYVSPLISESMLRSVGKIGIGESDRCGRERESAQGASYYTVAPAGEVRQKWCRYLVARLPYVLNECGLLGAVVDSRVVSTVRIQRTCAAATMNAPRWDDV